MSVTQEVRDRMQNGEKWYGDAVSYWKSIPATIDGMLGGFDNLTKVDAEGSKSFIRKLEDSGILTSGCYRALDCGAGIGRVTKCTLLPVFEMVDLVEQNADFLETAKSYLGDEAASVGDYFAQGLQEFAPRRKHYDLIWIQWVISHLTDNDFVDFLKRCRSGLRPGGCICLKENIAGSKEIFDEDDSSVTRTHAQFMTIFKAAGLQLRLMETQKGFPRAIYQVNMYSLT